MNISEAIKKHRKQLGLTQAQLAEKIDLKQYDIAKYERGIYKIPSETIPKIAEALSVTTDMLFGEPPKEVQQIAPKKSSRTGQLLEVFEKLNPVDQRAVLKQTKALAKSQEE